MASRVVLLPFAVLALLAASPVRIVPIPPPPPVEEEERLPSASLPRVAILIDERIEDAKLREQVSDLRVVEHEIIADWTKRGFVFQEIGTPHRSLSSSTDGGVVYTPENVDVIIVGTALTRVQGRIGMSLMDSGELQMTSCKAAISVRAFDARTGEILATFGGSKTSLHLDATVCGLNALKQITVQASEELRKGILARWKVPNELRAKAPDTAADP